MTFDIKADTRIDPRIKEAMSAALSPRPQADVASREAMLAEASFVTSSESDNAWSFLDRCDSEEAAPSVGLTVHTQQVVSAPDGNTIKSAVHPPRHRRDRRRASTTSTAAAWRACRAIDGIYRAWGQLIAAQGVAVAMVDFRNCVVPSSVPEVAPFPAGLNDCVSGSEVGPRARAELGVDPARVVVAGESGGGNLTLATGLKLKRDGDLGLIKGLYALCPYIAGEWPHRQIPVVDREQRDPDRPAQQPRRHRLRHRGLRRTRPAGLAVVRHRGRRHGLPAHRDQRQRVRPAARRGHRLLPPAAAGRRVRPGAAR